MFSSPTLATTVPDFVSDLQAARARRLQNNRLLSFIETSFGRKWGGAEIPDETRCGKLLLQGAPPELLQERAGGLQDGRPLLDRGDELHPRGQAVLSLPLGHKLRQPGWVERSVGAQLDNQAAGPMLEPSHAQRAEVVLQGHD